MDKIISGGQTGVDRAALDWARHFNIPHGGWCPAGRRAEDGVIPADYNLVEMLTATYPERTEMNIRSADATLIIAPSILPTRGTSLTRKLCLKLMPMRWVDADPCFPAYRITPEEHRFLKNAHTVNVAGPSASNWPLAQILTWTALNEIFEPGDPNVNFDEVAPNMSIVRQRDDENVEATARRCVDEWLGDSENMEQVMYLGLSRAKLVNGLVANAENYV
jgi:Circularly permutated YpsA SLOG family